MYGIYANIWGILMVNVTIYSIHGSYGIYHYFHVFHGFGASAGFFTDQPGSQKTPSLFFWGPRSSAGRVQGQSLRCRRPPSTRYDRVDWSVELHQLHQLHQLMSWIHYDPLWSMDGRSKELCEANAVGCCRNLRHRVSSMNFSRWTHAESCHHESRATEPLAPGHFLTFLEA